MGMFGGKKKRKAGVDENDFDDFDDFNDSANDMDDGGDFDNDVMDDDDEATPVRKKKGRRRTGGGSKSGGAGVAGGLPVLLGILAAVVILFFAITAIFGPRRGECKQLIAQFEEGCQTLNINEIAGCFKPSIRNGILAATAIGGMVTDSDSDEVLSNLLDTIGGGFGQMTQGTGMKPSELFKAIQITPKRYSLPGFTRTVKCEATYGMFTAYINFTIEKKNGEAYISNVEYIQE